jgi:ABC-type dipeptide/oligopeptide/nickel transport system permease subunit
MRLRYETGIGTMVQFIVTSSLSFLNTIISIVAGCTSGVNGACISNTLVSLVLIILIIFALGFLLVLGYAAQERRSSRLAKFLIASEIIAAFIFLYDTQHATNILERLTNLISCLLSIWVIILAWRLSRAKGGRVVKLRNRRRPTIKD